MNTLNRRKLIFNRFSSQLNFLKANGHFTQDLQFEKTYICPICLRQFSENHVQQSKNNFLTLEDAPPDKLMGSKIALTCKECNSTCGTTIDVHLVEALREIDANHFYPGSIQVRKIPFETGYVNVELTSLGNGTLRAYHSIKQNNPNLLDRFIYGIRSNNFGPLLNFAPPASRVIPARVNYALVKTNYILTFARFGYIFLLHPAYNQIRQQLLNPNEIHYPWVPFIKDQFTARDAGTYYIHNPGIESILNVFKLRTKYAETVIGGTLPLPFITTPDYGNRIDNLKDQQNGLMLDTTRYDPGADLFSNWNHMHQIINWIAAVAQRC
jgi:hypothetical protein